MDTRLRRYARWGHRKVQGGIEPEILLLTADLSAEQHRLHVRGGVCEIGVHHGRYFIGMHLTRQEGDRGSLALALFEDQAHNVDQSGSGDEVRFRQNLHSHAGGVGDVTIRAVDSTTIDGAYVVDAAGGRVRLFSVDGGHTAEVVAHDMRTAADSITPGGIIVGDDVFNFQWPGAAEGTFRFLDTCDVVVPFAIGFNKVLFTTPDHAGRYRAITRRSALRHRWELRESVMHGDPVVVVERSSLRRKPRVVVKSVIRRAA